MKDTLLKESESEEKVEETKASANTAVETKKEMKAESRDVNELEDESDKILNNITAGVENLNIKVSNDGTVCAQNITHEEENDDVDKHDSDDFTERGPNGGRPADHLMNAPGSILQKSMPMPVMMPNGHYYPCQPQQQILYSKNGNRRTYDETEDFQPAKFVRPQAYFDPAQLQQTPQNFNFGGTPMQNNLSDINSFSQQSHPMPFNPSVFSGLNFDGQIETTTMKITSPTGGAKVTVQTPLPAHDPVDELLQEVDSLQQFTNLPNLSSPSGIDFTQDNFSEYRRKSQDTDSGLESEGMGSPWSDQAPSPGNGMYNPPSVDSGCGRSPMHESQALPGMSPPKYPGSSSPASYRATPSPAATSGYGSPGQPQMEDEFNFSPDKQIELDLVLEVMKGVCNDSSAQRQSSKRQTQTSIPQQQVMPVSQNCIPQTVHQPCQPMPLQTMPQQVSMPGQPIIAPPTFNPQGVPVTSSTQSIIILPQQAISMPQPVIILPVNGQPTPQPKRTGPRKILPKISQQPSSGANTNTAGLSTSANQSCKTGVTMVTKTSPTNRNLTQQGSSADRAQQNKLLMIARRTVANIPREDLRKSDDEGDTYLHIAVCKTDRYMVQALLERLHREGLDSLVDQENNKRQTPLYLAVFINQPVMVAMFIKFQANVNVLAQNLSSDGMTTEVKAAIHVAAAQGKEHHRTLVELLKAKDISINIVNNYGQTALHCAIMAHGKAKRQANERINSIEIIQTLIKAGADPSAQDKKSGKTPLMYAIEQKSHELVEVILRSVEPEKVKNVVKTQAFDGSSCLKIAEGLKGSFDIDIWNKLWNSLQSAANGSASRFQFQSLQPVY